MNFLSELYVIAEGRDNKDLSILNDDTFKEIKKNIKDGAEDIEYEWANALELVHKAYKVAGVERPTPAMGGAWRQYEEMLQLGVEQLAKFRKDVGSDWRMSSSIFREAMEKRIKVRVYEIGDKFAKGHTVEARNMQEIIEMVRKQAGSHAYDMEVEESDESCYVCRFSYQGIKRNYYVKLQQL